MDILVVDDSAFMRKAIGQMLASDPECRVVGTGRDGREAVELARKLRPEVITLDIEMPVMDGLTALRHIMRECPTAVLVLSSLTVEGSDAALTALRLGAADVLAKDMSQVSLSITNIQQDLVARVKAIGAGFRARRAGPAVRTPFSAGQEPTFRPGQFDVICIGSSTGGPPVLEALLPALPATMSAPVVVAQHMPEMFTRALAQRLTETCSLSVRHAEDRMPLEPRTIYIAPGGQHTHLHKLGLARWELNVNGQPRDALFKPSVTALLQSAAEATAARTLAVILTGIGDDGCDGARALRARGGMILAQSEETCVVYGMPKAVTQAALVAASLAPAQIAACLQSLARPAAAPLRRTA